MRVCVQVFYAGDDDGNGSLDLDEFGAIVNRLNPVANQDLITDMFTYAYDHPLNQKAGLAGEEGEQDGESLSPAAFVAMCREYDLHHFLCLGDNGEMTELVALFQKFDADGSGGIDAEEFQSLCQDFGLKYPTEKCDRRVQEILLFELQGEYNQAFKVAQTKKKKQKQGGGRDEPKKAKLPKKPADGYSLSLRHFAGWWAREGRYDLKAYAADDDML